MATKTRLEVARDIASHLKPTEAAIDDVLIHVGGLITAMGEAPRAANLPIFAGQKALDEVIEAARLAAGTRRAMARAHLQFAATKRRIGLGETSIGDVYDTPAMGATETVAPAPPALKVVG